MFLLHTHTDGKRGSEKLRNVTNVMYHAGDSCFSVYLRKLL